MSKVGKTLAVIACGVAAVMVVAVATGTVRFRIEEDAVVPDEVDEALSAYPDGWETRERPNA